MSDALIGSTGFVGGTIGRARSFDACYRSTDIDTIRGREFDTIVCCGAPAEKWRANREPEVDRARLASLTNALAHVRARRFVLISTIDVYPVTSGVDEETPIDVMANHAYGRHRYELEEWCRERFDTTVVRLSALYGRGLKKNAIFDLLNDRPVGDIPGNARFQFYDVERVWSDVERILAAGIVTANITAEPVSMAAVAEDVFGRELSLWSDAAPSYDVRSIHAGLVNGPDHYWFDAADVIHGLRRFVEHERAQ